MRERLGGGFVPTVVLVSLFATGPAAGGVVELDPELPFLLSATPSEEPITIVVTPELRALEVSRRRRLETFRFPLGPALASNLERALRANFTTVEVVESRAAVRTSRFAEPRFVEIDPKLPATTFGTFRVRLDLAFAVGEGQGGSEREVALGAEASSKDEAVMVVLRGPFVAQLTTYRELSAATGVAMGTILDDLVEALRSDEAAWSVGGPPRFEVAVEQGGRRVAITDHETRLAKAPFAIVVSLPDARGVWVNASVGIGAVAAARRGEPLASFFPAISGALAEGPANEGPDLVLSSREEARFHAWGRLDEPDLVRFDGVERAGDGCICRRTVSSIQLTDDSTLGVDRMSGPLELVFVRVARTPQGWREDARDFLTLRFE